jgi:hypothetical protein
VKFALRSIHVTFRRFSDLSSGIICFVVRKDFVRFGDVEVVDDQRRKISSNRKVFFFERSEDA